MEIQPTADTSWGLNASSFFSAQQMLRRGDAALMQQNHATLQMTAGVQVETAEILNHFVVLASLILLDYSHRLIITAIINPPPPPPMPPPHLKPLAPLCCNG